MYSSKYMRFHGFSKDGQKYGYDTEAFAIYDTIQYIKPPVHTVAVGTAWGEAAMLLACGAPVNTDKRFFIDLDTNSL